MNVTGSYRQLSETHIGRHETYPVRGAVDSPEDTGKGLGNWRLKVNPYEGESALDWAVLNADGRLYCCQGMKLGEEHVQL